MRYYIAQHIPACWLITVYNCLQIDLSPDYDILYPLASVKQLNASGAEIIPRRKCRALRANI